MNLILAARAPGAPPVTVVDGVIQRDAPVHPVGRPGREGRWPGQEIANHLARPTLERYIDAVESLQARGRLSRVSAQELVSSARV